MAKAVWNGVVIAQSTETKVVDGNHYFPPESLVTEHLEESARTSVCGWKGTANYYDVVVDGQRNENAAWVYRAPKSAAEALLDHVAFWNGVTVTE